MQHMCMNHDHHHQAFCCDRTWKKIILVAFGFVFNYIYGDKLSHPDHMDQSLAGPRDPIKSAIKSQKGAKNNSNILDELPRCLSCAFLHILVGEILDREMEMMLLMLGKNITCLHAPRRDEQHVSIC
ncbi:hypothetical protein DAI22_10g193900 [Oryza sativa Japonica Group]|nr:hypothetical protein DAI22_10g193900 [Oryza sativa Japonica Group]